MQKKIADSMDCRQTAGNEVLFLGGVDTAKAGTNASPA
jgi:hypothetical protein